MQDNMKCNYVFQDELLYKKMMISVYLQVLICTSEKSLV